MRVTIPCAVALEARAFSNGTGGTQGDMGMLPIPCPTHPCGAALVALRGSPVVSKDRGRAGCGNMQPAPGAPQVR